MKYKIGDVVYIDLKWENFDKKKNLNTLIKPKGSVAAGQYMSSREMFNHKIFKIVHIEHEWAIILDIPGGADCNIWVPWMLKPARNILLGKMLKE